MRHTILAVVAAMCLAQPLMAEPLEELGVVRIQFVAPDHWGMRSVEEMRALRTDDGQKWVLINHQRIDDEFHGWLMHEMAHHLAWLRHGTEIATHGPEFRAACRELIKHRTAYFCKGRE